MPQDKNPRELQFDVPAAAARPGLLDQALDSPFNPVHNLSKIGLSMHKSDASQVCALKTRVNAHGQCTHFYAPYHSCFLVVSSMHNPLLSVGSEGEGVTGATPLFCGSCGARHPSQCALGVSVAALPGGGRSRHNNPCGKARIAEVEMA